MTGIVVLKSSHNSFLELPESYIIITSGSLSLGLLSKGVHSLEDIMEEALSRSNLDVQPTAMIKRRNGAGYRNVLRPWSPVKI